VPFYVYKRIDKPWEQIWALGIQSWGFGVKMEFYPRAVGLSSPWRASWWPWRVKKLSSSPWRVIGGHVELFSTTTHVFVVLGFWGPIRVF